MFNLFTTESIINFHYFITFTIFYYFIYKLNFIFIKLLKSQNNQILT